MSKPKTTSERVAKHRASGQQVAVVLTDAAAIAALAKLEKKHGGKKAAITHALIAAVRS